MDFLLSWLYLIDIQYACNSPILLSNDTLRTVNIDFLGDKTEELSQLQQKVAALETQLNEKDQIIKKLTDLFTNLVKSKDARISKLEAQLAHHKAVQGIICM